MGYIKNCFCVSYYSFITFIHDMNVFFSNNKDTDSEIYNKPKPDKTYNQLYNFDKINKMEDEIIYTKQPKKTIKRAYSDSKINTKKKYKNNDYNDYNDWDIV